MRLSQRRRDSKSYTAIEPYCCSAAAAAMSWCLICHLTVTIGSCLFSAYLYPQRVRRIMAQSSRNTYPLMRDRQQLSAQRNSSSVATLRMPTAFWLEAEAVPFILHDSLPAALLVIPFLKQTLGLAPLGLFPFLHGCPSLREKTLRRICPGETSEPLEVQGHCLVIPACSKPRPVSQGMFLCGR